MRLPLANDAFAAITCGFGLRNLESPARGVAEALRVLKPSGVFIVLEFFRPTRVATRTFHAVYARGVLPLVGSLVSGDREAYRYLSDSMQGFMTRDECCDLMRRVGFREAHAFDLTLGVASVVWGRK
jgi:ubiquinone/menaquinone biosynthesis methyltransferase